jgi:hypothetical protein
MDYFAGLDVSVKETSVCIVDDAGKIVRIKITEVTGHRSLEMLKTYSRDAKAFVGHAERRTALNIGYGQFRTYSTERSVRDRQQGAAAKAAPSSARRWP